tara:strand:+ start:31244 stop:31522 length:279 start_codon:yes stop_codon:yes gene_type:complete
MNFESTKDQAFLLKKDTLLLREIVSKVELSNEQLKSIITRNDSIIVPSYEAMIKNLEKMVAVEQKNGKRKYWKGAKDFGAFGLLIGLLLGLL